MKFAICNEIFEDQPAADTFSTIAKLGYEGVEVAPYTLAPHAETFDVRELPAGHIVDFRDRAEAAGLEIVGLHWLFAKTNGFHLTSPDPNVRRHTAEYLRALVEFCADLGGKVIVLGSPQQRKLLPGVTHQDAEAFAVEVLHGALSACRQYHVTIALEPLGPAEGDFLLTAESAIHLINDVESPHCKLHLDVKAMCTERQPIPEIIRASRDWLVHFHANDPNLLGPGMGDVDYEPIFAALKEINYSGWVSVEAFKREPSAEDVARQSIEYLRKTQAKLAP
jgi:sugar phosphate isomerase/epimerase